MRTINLDQFVKLRRQLSEERESLQARLSQISEALGELPLPSLASIQRTSGQSASAPARRGRQAAGGGQSLREHVMAVLQSGQQTKEEILAGVQNRGYKFSTSNPLNSLGVILYGNKPKLNRSGGKFSLGSGTGAVVTTSRGAGRRTMSPQARARIAAAQRARWAKQKGDASPKADAKPKRRMSAAGRKAIAAAARKRWAAAKAAGKSRL